MRVQIHIFSIKDNKLSKKYNEIWEKVTSIIYKKFDSDPVYNEKYIKTKVNPTMETLTQIFKVIKYQKKDLILFVYQ